MEQRLLARNSVKMYGVKHKFGEDEETGKIIIGMIKCVYRIDDQGLIVLQSTTGQFVTITDAEFHLKWKLQCFRLNKKRYKDPIRRDLHFEEVFETLCRPADCTTPLRELMKPYHNDPSNPVHDVKPGSFYGRDFTKVFPSYNEDVPPQFSKGAQAAINQLHALFEPRSEDPDPLDLAMEEQINTVEKVFDTFENEKA